jgi:hypothetical protein
LQQTADRLALHRFQKLFNHSESTNHTNLCADRFAKVQCAISFPACEIGSETSFLCESECVQWSKTCGVDAGFCHNTTFLHIPDVLTSDGAKIQQKASGKCFGLDYGGPNRALWIIGLSISVIFTFTTSIGLNLQKFSLSKNDKLEKPKTVFQQPLWVMGFVLITSGSILDFVAFGLAPATLLAPTAALSLIWNMIIAPWFHKEVVTRRNVVGTGVILVGVTATVIFAGHSTPNYDLDDLMHLYQQPIM